MSAERGNSGRALVIGGGVAGICAARALADHYGEVLIVERDRYPEAMDDRRGVPQGRMFHTLIERGRREIEALFPGFHALLDEWGAPRSAGGFNVAYMTPRGWGRPIPAAIPTAMFASRAMIEAAMRHLCLQIPNVRVMESTAVQRLLAEEVAGRLTCRGVRIKGADGDKDIAADLVVDASGGGSRAPQWLAELGLAPPVEEELDPMLSYGAQWLRLRADVRWPARWWWTHGVFLQRIPPKDLNSAHLMMHENGRWLLTMVAGGGGKPPSEPDEIAAFLGSLRSPLIAQIYPLFEAETGVRGYRLSKNRWRHYESWTGALDGFLAIGDAACVFNPNLGQGMSVAAAEAGILRQCLDRTSAPAELPRLFFAEQARFQANPWKLALCNDLRFDSVPGERPAFVRLFNWYRQQLAYARWWRVQRRLAEVDLLLRPPRAIFNPVIAVMAAGSRLVPGFGADADLYGARPPEMKDMTIPKRSWWRKGILRRL